MLRYILNFGDNAPLALTMAHTLSNRIQRLSMIKTTKKSIVVTVFIIISIAVLTAPNASRATELSRTDMVPMQLYFVPVSHDENIAKKHLIMDITPQFELQLFGTDVEAGQWDNTDVDIIINAITAIIRRCKTHSETTSGPIVYKASLRGLPKGLINGAYTVDCLKGTRRERRAQTLADEIKGVEVSTDFTASERAVMVRERIVRGRERFKRKTLSDDRLYDSEKTNRLDAFNAKYPLHSSH